MKKNPGFDAVERNKGALHFESKSDRGKKAMSKGVRLYQDQEKSIEEIGNRNDVIVKAVDLYLSVHQQIEGKEGVVDEVIAIYQAIADMLQQVPPEERVEFVRSSVERKLLAKLF